MEFKATYGQSIYDICLMTYGDFKYLYKLMLDNNIVGPNDTNLNGKVLVYLQFPDGALCKIGSAPVKQGTESFNVVDGDK